MDAYECAHMRRCTYTQVLDDPVKPVDPNNPESTLPVDFQLGE